MVNSPLWKQVPNLLNNPWFVCSHSEPDLQSCHWKVIIWLPKKRMFQSIQGFGIFLSMLRLFQVAITFSKNTLLKWLTMLLKSCEGQCLGNLSKYQKNRQNCQNKSKTEKDQNWKSIKLKLYKNWEIRQLEIHRKFYLTHV